MKKTIKFDADRPVSRKQIRNFGFYKDLAKSIEMHEVFDDLPANFKKLFGVEFNVPMACEVQTGYNWQDMEVVERK